VRTPFNEEFGQLTHDGRWLAYQSNESGCTEVYIQPFLGTGSKAAVSTGGGIAPRWRRDGRELFYLAPDGSLIAVPVHASADGNTLESGTPVRLFRAPIVGGGSIVIGAMQQVFRQRPRPAFSDQHDRRRGGGLANQHRPQLEGRPEALTCVTPPPDSS
jgi:hypothetical protein